VQANPAAEVVKCSVGPGPPFARKPGSVAAQQIL
jgi:hypothetical protein